MEWRVEFIEGAEALETWLNDNSIDPANVYSIMVSGSWFTIVYQVAAP